MRRGRKCLFWPSDCRLRISKHYKLVNLAFFITLLLNLSTDLLSVQLELLKTPRSVIRFPATSSIPGLNAAANYTFSLLAIVCLISDNVWLLVIIIQLSGDVHPNPGPESVSSMSYTSSTTDASTNLFFTITLT